MKTLNLLVGLLTLAGSAEAVDVSSPTVVGLQDSVRQALATSESRKIQESEVRLLEARYRQGVGAILPHLHWIRTETFQDTPPTSSSSDTTSVSGTLLKTRRPESYFLVTQPLFSGFKEFAGFSQTKALTEQARWQLKQIELQMAKDVSEIYFSILAIQEDLDFLKKNRDLTENRAKELKRWVSLGKSRYAEQLSTETQLASLDAQMAEDQRALIVARETFLYLTGFPETVMLRDEDPILPTLATIDDATKTASQRPDVLAAMQAVKAAEHGVRYAQADYYPSLDATGRYFTERVGFQSNVKWDAVLSLDVPIFDGLSTRADVKASKETLEQANLTVQQVTRLAQSNIRAAYQDWKLADQQQSLYDKAVELSEKNYALQLREYQNHLINNLEVLRFLTDRQAIVQSGIRAKLNSRLYAVRLKLEMGQF